MGMGGQGTCWEGGDWRVCGSIGESVRLCLLPGKSWLQTHTHKYKCKGNTLHISKIRSKLCDLKQGAGQVVTTTNANLLPMFLHLSGQVVITKKIAVVCVWPLPCNIIILISSLLLEHATHRLFYTRTIKLKAKYVKCTLQPVPVNARHISAFVHKKNPGRILPFRLFS